MTNPWHGLSRQELLLVRKTMLKAIHPDVWKHEAAGSTLTQLNEEIDRANKAMHRFVIVKGSMVKWRFHWWEVLKELPGSRFRVRLVRRHPTSFSRLYGRSVEYVCNIARSEVTDARVAVNRAHNYMLIRHPKGKIDLRCDNQMFNTDRRVIYTARRSPGYTREQIVNRIFETGEMPGANPQFTLQGSVAAQHVNGKSKDFYCAACGKVVNEQSGKVRSQVNNLNQ